MGGTTCTETQSLYKDALYLYILESLFLMEPLLEGTPIEKRDWILFRSKLDITLLVFSHCMF